MLLWCSLASTTTDGSSLTSSETSTSVQFPLLQHRSFRSGQSEDTHTHTHTHTQESFGSTTNQERSERGAREERSNSPKRPSGYVFLLVQTLCRHAALVARRRRRRRRRRKKDEERRKMKRCCVGDKGSPVRQGERESLGFSFWGQRNDSDQKESHLF